MEHLFLAAGQSIQWIGLIPSILVFALLPLYACLIIFAFRGYRINTSALTLASSIGTGIISLLLCAVFFISAMALGIWG